MTAIREKPSPDQITVKTKTQALRPEAKRWIDSLGNGYSTSGAIPIHDRRHEASSRTSTRILD